MKHKIMLSEICDIFNLHYIGFEQEIRSLNFCNRFSMCDHILSYATTKHYIEKAINSEKIVGLVVNADDIDEYKFVAQNRKCTLIPCLDPETIFYDIYEYLYGETDFYEQYDFRCKIGTGCKIHESTIIEDGVVIGNHVSIGAHSVIKKGTIIKDFCSIGCNTVIGSEGFQILKKNGINRKIPHCGGVTLEEYVHVGDNVTVGNSLFENTSKIGRNVMIDNLSYIGHNVVIEDNAVITAGTILCGSVIVKKGAWIGPNSSVLNRVTIENKALVGMGSVVTRDVPKEMVAYGVPAKVKI